MHVECIREKLPLKGAFLIDFVNFFKYNVGNYTWHIKY
jgi:hypothetical protein